MITHILPVGAAIHVRFYLIVFTSLAKSFPVLKNTVSICDSLRKGGGKWDKMAALETTNALLSQRNYHELVINGQSAP